MLAKQIRFLRQSMQLNQVELGKRLGVAKQSISNWEKDNIMPSVEMLVKIADFFHVSTDYLLGRDCQESDSIKILDITVLHRNKSNISNILWMICAVGKNDFIIKEVPKNSASFLGTSFIKNGRNSRWFVLY